MKRKNMVHSQRLGCCVFTGIFLLSACQPSLWGSSLTPTPILPIMMETPIAAVSTPTVPPIPATSTPAADAPHVWAGAAVPPFLGDLISQKGFQITTTDRESTKLFIDITQGDDNTLNISTWTFALVAPFPTLVDDITSQDLLSSWDASSTGPFSGIPLLVDESTLTTFSTLWGDPAQDAVRVVSTDQLLDTAWSQMPAWAIIPFEAVEPKWKVLMIDGQSPIQKGFDPSTYPLIANYELTCSEECPPPFAFQNRDPNKLTTVILTGVTALVRATAASMEKQGILYPGEIVREILLEADITHINNEVPFYRYCPPPDPIQQDLKFCSDTRYIDLLLDIGADVIELSGDHFADYGPDAMYETIAIYKENNLPYYGGGINLEDGRKPLLLEVNGNKLMFIGCNVKTEYATAADTSPGSVPCDFDYLIEQTAHYRSQGYLPIATFQYHEYETANAAPRQMLDFRAMADAGAVVVSGSQAHVPQVMEFYDGAFIHYGLGNLFFDQFEKETSIKQSGFIDRHVFYDGRYLGVELIATFLPDYARPRFMNETERKKFLSDYFAESGWIFPQASQ
jgi:hypothetical protein